MKVKTTAHVKQVFKKKNPFVYILKLLSNFAKRLLNYVCVCEFDPHLSGRHARVKHALHHLGSVALVVRGDHLVSVVHAGAVDSKPTGDGERRR